MKIHTQNSVYEIEHGTFSWVPTDKGQEIEGAARIFEPIQEIQTLKEGEAMVVVLTNGKTVTTSVVKKIEP